MACATAQMAVMSPAQRHVLQSLQRNSYLRAMKEVLWWLMHASMMANVTVVMVATNMPTTVSIVHMHAPIDEHEYA